MTVTVQIRMSMPLTFLETFIVRFRLDCWRLRTGLVIFKWEIQSVLLPSMV